MKRNHILRTILSTLLCLMMVTPSLADVLTLPSGTKVIEEYAFYGDTSIDEVVLPEGIEEIGDYAFAESSLTKINLPSTLGEGSIADNAIDKGVEVTAIEGTEAYEWAVVNGYISNEQPKESPVEDFIFRTRADGNVWIDGYTGNDSTIVTPKTYGTKPVTGIFSISSDNIKDITVSQGVKTIGGNAFTGCPNLEKITFSDGVESIGYSAFSGCENLITIVLPDSITEIESSAFYKCTSLKSIVLPKLLEEIEDYTFAECSMLENIHFPESLKAIGFGAFSECVSLKQFTFPDNLIEIESNAFEKCTQISKLVFNDQLNSIGNGAFRKCSGLEKVTFQSELVLIDKEAFCQCSSLESVDFNSLTGCLSLGESAFYNCSGLETISLPNGVIEINDSCFSECTNLKEISIPSSIRTIGQDAFSNCSTLEKINFSATQRLVLGSYVFASCTKLKSLILPEGLSSIGDDPISGCKQIISLQLPSSLQSAGNLWLQYFPNLQIIYAKKDSYAWAKVAEYGLEDRLMDIDNKAMSETLGTEFEYNGHMLPYAGSPCWQTIKKYIGTGKHIVIPITYDGELVRGIDAEAFMNCSSIVSIVLPAYMESIGERAFANCYDLEELVIPEKITSIDESAFSNCTKLNRIYAEEGSYGWIWMNNHGLGSALRNTANKEFIFKRYNEESSSLSNYSGTTAEITIPETDYYGRTVTGINSGAFNLDSNIVSVTIPDTVKYIDQAFRGCINLSTVYIPDSVEYIDKIVAFNACPNLTICCSKTSYAWKWAMENGFEEMLVELGSSSGQTQTVTGEISTVTGEPVSGVTIIATNTSDSSDTHSTISVPDGTWSMEVDQNATYSISYSHNLLSIIGDVGTARAGDHLNATATSSNGQFITFDAEYSDIIGPGEEVTSVIANGPIVSRIQYQLKPEQEISIPFSTDLSSEKVTVKLRYWNEAQQNYYTFCVNDAEIAASTTDFQTVGNTKKGMLKLTIPTSEDIRTGLYVLQLWSKNSQDIAVDARVKIKVISAPWTGYVQEDSIPTYAGPTGTTLRGLRVDNTDPVLVLEEDETRYRIEMITDEGVADNQRWVDKEGIKETYMPWAGYVQGEQIPVYATSDAQDSCGVINNVAVCIIMDKNGRYELESGLWISKKKIGKNNWVDNGGFTGVSVNDGTPGQLRSADNVYCVTAFSRQQYDKVIITCRGNELATITKEDAIYDHNLYRYSKDIYLWEMGGEVSLTIKGYDENQLIARISYKFYLVDEYERDAYKSSTFLIRPECNLISSIPTLSSAVEEAHLNTEASIIGVYPNNNSPQYYFIGYEDIDGTASLGFIKKEQADQQLLRITHFSSARTAIDIELSIPNFYTHYYIDCNGNDDYFDRNRNPYRYLIDAYTQDLEFSFTIKCQRRDKNNNLLFEGCEIILPKFAIGNLDFDNVPVINLSGVSVSEHGIRLNWSGLNTSSAVIYRSTTGSKIQSDWQELTLASGSTYLDIDVEKNEVYYYFIQAIEVNWYQNVSTIYTSNIFAIKPIGMPRMRIRAKYVADNPNAVGLVWDDPIADENYEIAWTDTAGGTYQIANVEVKTPTACIVNNISSDNLAYFKMRYYDNSVLNDGTHLQSYSDWSDPASISFNSEKGKFRVICFAWEDHVDSASMEGALDSNKSILFNMFNHKTPEGLEWIRDDNVCIKNAKPSIVKQEITSIANKSDEKDITWIAIFTHGKTFTSGELAGKLSTPYYDSNNKLVEDSINLNTLATWLSNIPGRIIVQFGSCGSGIAIYNIAELAFMSKEQVDESKVKVYANEIGQFRSEKFIVLASADPGESGIFKPNDSSKFWITIRLNEAFNSTVYNNDGIIYLNEMESYLKSKEGTEHSTSDSGISFETYAVYPENSNFELFK